MERKPVRHRRTLVLAWILLALVGCGERIDQPVAAGFDAQETELAEYLADLYQSARAAPQSATLRGRLGMAYDANGFVDAANASYGQAEALDPGEFLWPYHQALLHAELGLVEEALAFVERAIALDPHYLPARLQRGAWLLDLDRIEAARDVYGKLLDEGVEGEVRAAAIIGLSRSELRQSRYPRVVDLLEPLAADVPHPYVYVLLGKAYRALGRPQDAADAARRGKGALRFRWRDERRDAKDEHVRGFHGRLGVAEKRLQHGEAREAATMLEALRESGPEDTTLLNNLAIAYQLTGRESLAFDVLRHGIEVRPDYYLFHFNLANLFEERGEPDLAIEHFGRAAELAPGLVSAYERKGLLLIRQGKYDAALVAFDAMRPYGERALALYYSAMVEGARSRWQEAVDLLERAVRLDPELTKGHINLGRAYAEMGRFGPARAALAQAERLGSHPRELAAARARLAGLEKERS